MGIFFWGFLKFQIFFWGAWNSWYFWGLKGRCWAPAYVCRKIESSPPPPPSLVLVQTRKTCPCLTERLLMGRKESNQTDDDLPIHFVCKLPLFRFTCCTDLHDLLPFVICKAYLKKHSFYHNFSLNHLLLERLKIILDFALFAYFSGGMHRFCNKYTY